MVKEVDVGEGGLPVEKNLTQETLIQTGFAEPTENP